MTDNEFSNVKAEKDFNEVVSETVHHNITPQEIQARFETLRDLSEEQMAALNKRVLKILDWRLMPCITLMFLMK
jgi:transposase-like protein